MSEHLRLQGIDGGGLLVRRVRNPFLLEMSSGLPFARWAAGKFGLDGQEIENSMMHYWSQAEAISALVLELEFIRDFKADPDATVERIVAMGKAAKAKLTKSNTKTNDV